MGTEGSGGSGPAWDAARLAGDAAGVTIAPVDDLPAAEEAASIVVTLWGEGQMTPSLIRALQHAGTVVLAARAEGAMVGFVLGFAGLADGLHMHSHMLGVLPQWQGRGVGLALKVAQRAACLDAGVDEGRWTYDPLVVRNGWFNLVKLGAIGIRFLRGFYGEMGDVINQGDRSDRFEVRWDLRSDRVEGALRREAPRPVPGPLLLDLEGPPEAPAPRAFDVAPDRGAVVRVPPDHHAIRARHPGLGREWRDASARAFDACFAEGLVATWISREGAYVFEPMDEVT